MKKAFITLLVLVALGFCAFAQDVAATLAAAAPAAVAPAAVTAKFNLNILTGAYYDAGSQTVVAGDSDNLSDNTSRFDFKGDLNYGDVGAKFTFRKQSIDATSPVVRRAFAYYNFLGGKAQFQAGRTGSGDFATSCYGAVALDNGVVGALLTIKPLDGLELGFVMPVSSPATDIGDAFKASTAAISYSLADAFTAQLWVRQFDDLALVGDLNVTAVKSLLLTAEVAYNDPIDYEGGTTHILEQVAYTFGKFTPSVTSSQVLVQDAAKTGGNFSDTSYYVQPGLAYAITDKFTVGAEFKYGNAYTNVDGVILQVADAVSIFDAYAKYDWGKASIKVKPGYDTTTDKGFFVRCVFDATL